MVNSSDPTTLVKPVAAAAVADDDAAAPDTTSQTYRRQQQQQQQYQEYAETSMNRSLLDPNRYGWTATGGITDLSLRKYAPRPVPKLNLSVVIEFPLGPPSTDSSLLSSSSPSSSSNETKEGSDDPSSSSTSKSKPSQPVFRETIPWDLSDPKTPSPMLFATEISQEWGLNFDQTMDLALSIERQIDAHVNQYCSYAEPVAPFDPYGEERPHLGPLVQPYKYDPVISYQGNEGGMMKPAYNNSRRSDPSRYLSGSSHGGASTTATSSRKRPPPSSSQSKSKSSKLARKQQRGVSSSGSSITKLASNNNDHDFVEPIYCQEVKKRLILGSIADTQRRHGKNNNNSSTGKFKLEMVRDIQCHICHKKRHIVYSFGCGKGKHMYCESHIKSRIPDIEKDEDGNYVSDTCPVCVLDCTCALCTRKLKYMCAAFKASCIAQRASPDIANYPNIIEKSQSTENVGLFRQVHKTPVLTDNNDTVKVKQKSPSKKRSLERSSSYSSRPVRRAVSQPPLVDFAQEYHKGLDLEYQVPGWADLYFSQFLSKGQTAVSSVPDAWVRPTGNEETNAHSNLTVVEDGNVAYCHVCKQPGDLLCCDTCPRAFHSRCLGDKSRDVSKEATSWECPVCPQERNGFAEDTLDGQSYLPLIVQAFSPFHSAETPQHAVESLDALSRILAAINRLIGYDFGSNFAEPVDSEKVKGYAQIVERPIGLQSISSNIIDGGYSRMLGHTCNIDDVVVAILKDIHLCFHNCLLFNREGSSVFRMAQVLLKRSDAIQAKSFEHLLSQNSKDKLSSFRRECCDIRKQMNPPGGQMLVKGFSKEDAVKIWKPTSRGPFLACPTFKRAINTPIALFDPVGKRVVKIYSSRAHASSALQAMRSTNHPSEDQIRLSDKTPSKSAADPFYFLYGFRWLNVEDLKAGKVKFADLGARLDLTKVSFVKRDTVTENILDGFIDKKSAYDDWSNALFSSPTHEGEEQTITLATFESSYLNGKLDVDGVVWEEYSVPESPRPPLQIEPGPGLVVTPSQCQPSTQPEPEGETTQNVIFQPDHPTK